MIEEDEQSRSSDDRNSLDARLTRKPPPRSLLAGQKYLLDAQGWAPPGTPQLAQAAGVRSGHCRCPQAWPAGEVDQAGSSPIAVLDRPTPRLLRDRACPRWRDVARVGRASRTAHRPGRLTTTAAGRREDARPRAFGIGRIGAREHPVRVFLRSKWWDQATARSCLGQKLDQRVNTRGREVPRRHHAHGNT